MFNSLLVGRQYLPITEWLHDPAPQWKHFESAAREGRPGAPSVAMTRLANQQHQANRWSQTPLMPISLLTRQRLAYTIKSRK
jgi:hypothetical protein